MKHSLVIRLLLFCLLPLIAYSLRIRNSLRQNSLLENVDAQPSSSMTTSDLPFSPQNELNDAAIDYEEQREP